MTDRCLTVIANRGWEVYTVAPTAMETSMMLICVTAACFLLAGAVKGVTGMGLPTVVMCTLVLVMPGSRAAALLVVPSLVTNVWQLFAGPGLGEVARRLALMQVFSFAGTFLGIGYLTGKASPVGSAVLGGVLCVYALMALMSVKLVVPRRWEPFISPFIGLATGVLGGATGLFVVPAVPYIAALGLSGNHLIKALGLSFGVSTISLALALAWKGAFGIQMAGALRVGPAACHGGHDDRRGDPPPAAAGNLQALVPHRRSPGGAVHACESLALMDAGIHRAFSFVAGAIICIQCCPEE